MNRRWIAVIFLMVLALFVAACVTLTQQEQFPQGISDPEMTDVENISVQVLTQQQAGVTVLFDNGPESEAEPYRDGHYKQFAPSVNSDGMMSPLNAQQGITPGIYCHSTGSDGAMQNCKDAGGIGVFYRFAWCELLNTDGTYDFSPLENWISRNTNAEMRSIIGFKLKDLRWDSQSHGGTCTATSDSSPSIFLGGIYNDDILGTPATPLVNPASINHLNYLDNNVQTEIDNFIAAIGNWLSAYEVSNPGEYSYIESVEIGFGEMDSGGTFGTSPDYYSDADMYQCRFGDGVWTPDTGEPGSINHGYCTWPEGASESLGSYRWRDNYLVPMLRSWLGVDPGSEKMKLITISNPFYDSWIEYTTQCDTCNGQNLIDWVYDLFGGRIGYHATGGNVDQGDGFGPDVAGYEYRNWPNVLKMRWPGRLTSIETGGGSIGEGAPGCCDTEREIYWNALQAIDYGVSYWMMLPGYVYTLRNTTGVRNAKEFWSNTAGYNGDWTGAPMIGIWFRDTQGTYYPDGNNQTFGNPSINRGPDPCCWWKPNYQFLVYQRNWDDYANQANDKQVLYRDSYAMPDNYRSWWARRTTSQQQNFDFDIDAAWRPSLMPPQSIGGCAAYNIKVDYLDKGTDTFTFRYPQASGDLVDITVTKTDSNTWKSLSRPLTDWDMRNHINGEANFQLRSNDAADVFHSVVIMPSDPTCATTPTPFSGTSTPVPGSTSTPTPISTLAVCTPVHSGDPTVPPPFTSATPTPPQGPTATWTPIRTIAPTRTPTVTPTWTPGGPTPTPTRTPFP